MIKLRDMSVSSSKLDLKQSDIFGHEKHWDVPQDRDTTGSKNRSSCGVVYELGQKNISGYIV